jgi:hypothetical protein
METEVEVVELRGTQSTSEEGQRPAADLGPLHVVRIEAVGAEAAEFTERGEADGPVVLEHRVGGRWAMYTTTCFTF